MSAKAKPVKTTAAPAAPAAPASATAAPVEDTNPVTETVVPEVKPDVPETKPVEEVVTEAEKQSKSELTVTEAEKQSKSELTEDEFVLKLLKKHLDDGVAESWAGKVLEAVRSGRIVTITEVDGSNVLEIHKDLFYADRQSVKSLAARLGVSFKVSVTQDFLDKFPRK